MWEHIYLVYPWVISSRPTRSVPQCSSFMPSPAARISRRNRLRSWPRYWTGTLDPHLIYDPACLETKLNEQFFRKASSLWRQMSTAREWRERPRLEIREDFDDGRWIRSFLSGRILRYHASSDRGRSIGSRRETSRCEKCGSCSDICGWNQGSARSCDDTSLIHLYTLSSIWPSRRSTPVKDQRSTNNS